MGEAKRRKHEIEHNKKAKEALLTLQGDEGVVARTAIAVLKKTVINHDMVNGCYNLAFFMSEYLKREFGIDVERRFGWVTNSICLPVGMAHAWILYNEKITDLSVFNQERPDILFPGSALIQGIPYRTGNTNYIYSDELPYENRDKREVAARQHPYVAEQFKRHEDDFLKFKAMSLRPTGAEEYFALIAEEPTNYFMLKAFLTSTC